MGGSMNTVTHDLAEFGWRELTLAKDLLNALIEQGTPDNFEYDGISIAFNKNSGYVFLTNNEYQVAMMNGDKLESYYTCSECGVEGFKDEIKYTRGLCGECFEKFFNAPDGD